MTATPAPESVRRLALSIEKALTIVREAIEVFEAETSPPDEAPFPGDRPSTREQHARLDELLLSHLLGRDEVEQLRARIAKGLRYVQARDLIARIDAQLEERSSGEVHLHERKGVR